MRQYITEAMNMANSAIYLAHNGKEVTAAK